MKEECTKEKFLRNVVGHKMNIVAEYGIIRHIDFCIPGNINMSFQLTTWPQHLCISGDMGTYVFSRVEDMFTFFRRNNLVINDGYWHEKLEAECTRSHSRKYSEDVFQQNIKERFDSWFDGESFDAPTKSKVWEEIEADVLDYSEFDQEAYHAAIDFKSEHVPAFNFWDFYEVDSRIYTYHFIWCLYAIVWGIQQYDAKKAEPVIDGDRVI